MKKYKKAILALSSFILLTPSKPVYASEVKVTISFVGDCTLGNDKNANYERSFNNLAKKNNYDYSYYLEDVSDIFKNDDYTVANLECVLTNETKYVEKQFNFKGKKEYANILVSGNVDCVNISNNHTHDYTNTGYIDTINTMNNAGIDFYGDDYILLKEIKGIKFAFVGFKNNVNYSKIDEKFKNLESIEYDYLVMSSHYGIEGNHEFSFEQQNLYHYMIDKGADIVIGHHPHVLQGIENYKGKYIAYSLGNFCYGGHSNPKDKDTMIFQETISFDENKNIKKENINIIPCSISSTKEYNDFKPTILEGNEKVRVLEKIKDLSYNYK